MATIPTSPYGSFPRCRCHPRDAQNRSRWAQSRHSLHFARTSALLPRKARYMRSPPCQALLPSALLVTFLLCMKGDISNWLQHSRSQLTLILTSYETFGAFVPMPRNSYGFDPARSSTSFPILKASGLSDSFNPSRTPVQSANALF